MSRSLLHDWEYNIEKCCRDNHYFEMLEIAEDIYNTAYERGKNNKESIPYLMHKEMNIPISECQKAYDVAIDYLRSQAKVKG